MKLSYTSSATAYLLLLATTQHARNEWHDLAMRWVEYGDAFSLSEVLRIRLTVHENH